MGLRSKWTCNSDKDLSLISFSTAGLYTRGSVFARCTAMNGHVYNNKRLTLPWTQAKARRRDQTRLGWIERAVGLNWYRVLVQTVDRPSAHPTKDRGGTVRSKLPQSTLCPRRKCYDYHSSPGPSGLCTLWSIPDNSTSRPQGPRHSQRIESNLTHTHKLITWGTESVFLQIRKKKQKKNSRFVL